MLFVNKIQNFEVCLFQELIQLFITSFFLLLFFFKPQKELLSVAFFCQKKIQQNSKGFSLLSGLKKRDRFHDLFLILAMLFQ